MGEEIVCRVVALEAGIDPEQARTAEDLWAVGLTSLAAVRILMDLEDEFGITFPPDSLTRGTFSSIPRLTAALENARAQAPASQS